MRTLAVVGISVTLGLVVPAHADIVVTVSKSQQRAAIVVDGTEAYRWPVSTGLRRYDTPNGIFRPGRLERHWYSRQYEMTPMPWAVFFHRGYAMHATMESYNLGRAASHGCVRLRPDNAAILYSLVRRHGMKNTKVVVTNAALPPLPGALPLADAGENSAAEHFAKASPAEEEAAPAQQNLRARTHHASAQPAEEEAPRPVARPKMAMTTFEAMRVSFAADEARVLREREAWLRGLDRKYGIGR